MADKRVAGSLAAPKSLRLARNFVRLSANEAFPRIVFSTVPTIRQRISNGSNVFLTNRAIHFTKMQRIGHKTTLVS